MSVDAVLTILLLAGVAALAGLVGIWAAVSERDWFWRALGVWGCVAVLVPVRVWEPAMVFGIALPLIVGLVRFPSFVSWCRGASGMRSLRFRLLDVLLAMAIVGLSLVVLQPIYQESPRVSLYEIVVPAMVMAGLTAVTWWVVRGPRRVVAGLALIFLAPLSALLLMPKVDWLFTIETLGLYYWGPFIRKLFPTNWQYYKCLLGSIAGVIAFESLLVGGLLASLPQLKRLRESRLVWTVKWLGGAALGILLVWPYWQLARLRPFPPSFEGEGNQAIRINALAGQIVALNPWQSATNARRPMSAHSPGTARELEQLYGELLRLLEALNCVPFDPTRDATKEYWENDLYKRPIWLRDLCQCLEAEWRDAEAKGDRERALDYVFGDIRLVAMCCRNSIASECLIGYALMAVGRFYFLDKRDALTDDQIARLMTEFERAETEHESLENIIQRDLALDERVLGWQWRIPNLIRPGQRETWLREEMQYSYRRLLVVNRLLVADLTVRQFRREHGEWPDSLTSLVPKYLRAEPIDTFSGAPLVYRSDGDDFLLYSVGPDRVDDGGRLGDYSATRQSGFDLDLDTLTRPQGMIVEPKVRSESERGREEKHEDAKGTKSAS